jgi:hypothetical protein
MPGTRCLRHLLIAMSSAPTDHSTPSCSASAAAQCDVDVCIRYCQPTFDDSHWRVIDVPHDFVVEGSFSRTADQAHGYLPFGVGWYRKHLDIPSHDAGAGADAVYELTLDGVQVTPLALQLRWMTSCAGAEHRVVEWAHAWAARFRLHFADLRHRAGAVAGAQQRAGCKSRRHTARQLVV